MRAEGALKICDFLWQMENYSGKLTKIVQYVGKLTFLEKTVNFGGKLRYSEKIGGKLSVIFPLRGGLLILSPRYDLSVDWNSFQSLLDISTGFLRHKPAISIPQGFYRPLLGLSGSLPGLYRWITFCTGALPSVPLDLILYRSSTVCTADSTLCTPEIWLQRAVVPGNSTEIIQIMSLDAY